MRQRLFGVCVLAVVAFAAAGCDGPGSAPGNPELAPHGTTFTTTKPTRQNLANRVSLTGKVTMNPVIGIAAPARGQVHYLDVSTARHSPSKPTKVATLTTKGRPSAVMVPVGATFAGRLVDEHATVTAGMPIVSAKLNGYGIVADIDSAQAYRISGALGSVRAQIKNGPGPFPCTVMGTIAALPEGSVPDPPAPKGNEPGGPPVPPAGAPNQSAADSGPPDSNSQPSEPTGMRVVCTAAADVTLINGASATVEVLTEQAVNALVVPIEAVAGTQGRGKVDVVGPDRSRQTRDVVLGLTDGKVVQIKSGLKGDETLAVPGPNIPAAETRGDGQPGGEGGSDASGTR